MAGKTPGRKAGKTPGGKAGRKDLRDAPPVKSTLILSAEADRLVSFQALAEGSTRSAVVDSLIKAHARRFVLYETGRGSEGQGGPVPEPAPPGPAEADAA